MGKNRQTWLFFVGGPQVSLQISQGSIIFFLLEDMSVMCLSLLTNSVGFKGKELQNVLALVIFSTKDKVIRTLLINYMPVSII